MPTPETTRMLNICVSIWDSGCLPNLLRKEIGDVERSLRVTPHDPESRKAYLEQLQACLSSVEVARPALKENS